MQRRLFLGASAATLLPIAAPAVFAQGGGKLTPLKFTLDFRINGQTAPFFLAHSKG
jgi:ABC-type nitrate/sulfonate/bicarbonate transport system substrate-binding protein